MAAVENLPDVEALERRSIASMDRLRDDAWRRMDAENAADPQARERRSRLLVRAYVRPERASGRRLKG